MGKKAIVIGANGYLGKHICHFLLEYGISVVKYDITVNNDVKYIDITKIETLSKIDFNVDFVFMFAGMTGRPYDSFDNYHKYVFINEIGLLNILEAIRQSGLKPKVIYPSSRLVYKASSIALKETDEIESKSIYALTKIACENILKTYSNIFGIPFTIFRIGVPYGNYFSEKYGYGMINSFIEQVKKNKSITIYGDGNYKRTFTEIEDLSRQIITTALNSKSNNEIYNVMGQIFSINEIAEIISKKYGVKVIHIPWNEKDELVEVGDSFFDSTKIKQIINSH